MRDFTKIDPIINDWVAANNLDLLSGYKDTPVRSVNYFDSKKVKWQIWIEPDDGDWCIHWWNYKDAKRTFKTPASELREHLQSIIDNVSSFSL